LVEHATENRSVGGSIPPLGTTELIEPVQEILFADRLVHFRSVLVATLLQPEIKKVCLRLPLVGIQRIALCRVAR
jgi:hypothetical protein